MTLSGIHYTVGNIAGRYGIVTTFIGTSTILNNDVILANVKRDKNFSTKNCRL